MRNLIAVGVMIAFFGGVTFVQAWTGPTQSPPSGNISAPLNVGTTDQVKNAGLSVNSLIVYGNALISGVSKYLNFGSTPGSSGYGIRDNAGTMEVRNSNYPTWYSIATTTAAGFPYIRFSDGTRQTTAAVSVPADNLGNHTLTQNLTTGGYWLSGTGGSSGIYVDPTNNYVGIRTVSPAYPFEVTGATAFNQAVTMMNNLTVMGSTGILEVYGNADTSGNLYISGGGSVNKWVAKAYGPSHGTVSVRNSLRFYFDNNGTVNDAINLRSNGYVGIGIGTATSISYPLEVNGAAGKNDGSTLWLNASDARLKDVLGKYTKGLTDILKWVTNTSGCSYANPNISIRTKVYSIVHRAIIIKVKT
jgi:hypothetical protein